MDFKDLIIRIPIDTMGMARPGCRELSPEELAELEGMREKAKAWDRVVIWFKGAGMSIDHVLEGTRSELAKEKEAQDETK